MGRRHYNDDEAELEQCPSYTVLLEWLEVSKKWLLTHYNTPVINLLRPFSCSAEQDNANKTNNSREDQDNEGVFRNMYSAVPLSQKKVQLVSEPTCVHHGNDCCWEDAYVDKTN
jgi:hypothetical protein